MDSNLTRHKLKLLYWTSIAAIAEKQVGEERRPPTIRTLRSEFNIAIIRTVTEQQPGGHQNELTNMAKLKRMKNKKILVRIALLPLIIHHGRNVNINVNALSIRAPLHMTSGKQSPTTASIPPSNVLATGSTATSVPPLGKPSMLIILCVCVSNDMTTERFMLQDMHACENKFKYLIFSWIDLYPILLLS